MADSAERLVAPVVGPSAIFPRGYRWVGPAWFAAAVIALIRASSIPPWIRLCLAASLTGVLIVLLIALSTLRIVAFAADKNTISIGLPPSSRRRGRQRRKIRRLTWDQIERVYVADKRYGARVELVLTPAATAALGSERPRRAGGIRQVAAWLALLVPGWYLRRRTALITPLDNPTRYRLRLGGLTGAELRQRLREVAPAGLRVSLLRAS